MSGLCTLTEKMWSVKANIMEEYAILRTILERTTLAVEVAFIESPKSLSVHMRVDISGTITLCLSKLCASIKNP